MDRRQFVSLGAGAVSLALTSKTVVDVPVGEYTHTAPTRSVIPVVGDGTWVWTKPPEDQTGYLEPRPFELKVGVEITGRGNATNIQATTPVPLPLPEQAIDSASIDKFGCEADFRQLAPEAGQLLLAAPAIVKGQKLGASATIKLTLHKEYFAHEKDKFPQSQPRAPKDFAKQYLYDSPGIQTRAAELQELAKKVGGQIDHPWDKAKAFHAWVWENIRPQIGPYTSVVAALRDRVGDCEEHAAVFTALCRASQIPARLVWVPNHNWAEFYLADESGKGHWIPAHTSAYSWFGWTGVHELVLQKGDSIKVPEKGKPQRLLEDWMQWVGVRPTARWFAEFRPLPRAEGADVGPGARSKDAKGEWLIAGTHELDRYLRDGVDSAARVGLKLQRQ